MSSKRHLTEAGKRLIRDLKKLKIDPPAGIIAAPAEDNIMVWLCLDLIAYRFTSIELGRCHYWVCAVDFFFLFTLYPLLSIDPPELLGKVVC